MYTIYDILFQDLLYLVLVVFVVITAVVLLRSLILFHFTHSQQMSFSWVPTSCSVSLSFSAVGHGRPYTGTSTITYQRCDTHCCSGDEDSSTPSSSLTFHACPQRVSIEKISVTAGKKSLKVKSTTRGSLDGSIALELDSTTVSEAVVLCEVQIGFTSQIAECGVVTGIYCCATGGSSVNTLLTHFEVSHAREAFPCPDDPGLRLEGWRIQIQVPKSFAFAIGNTPLQDVKTATGAGGGSNVFAFSKTSLDTPLPAYVLAFAAFCDGVVKVVEEAIVRDEAPLQLRVVHPYHTAFPIAHLRAMVRESVARLEAFFAAPLPCEANSLTLLVCPCMSLGGMEHHSCIFLNEALCGVTSCPGAARKQVPQKKVEEDVARLVVHELAHHWVGNAIGLPFELKEGICLLLEQHIGDEVLGRRSKKAAGCDATQQQQQPARVECCAGDVKGRELTERTYSDALRKMDTLVGSLGWDVFEASMQKLLLARYGAFVDADEFSSFLVTQ